MHISYLYKFTTIRMHGCWQTNKSRANHETGRTVIELWWAQFLQRCTVLKQSQAKLEVYLNVFTPLASFSCRKLNVNDMSDKILHSWFFSDRALLTHNADTGKPTGRCTGESNSVVELQTNSYNITLRLNPVPSPFPTYKHSLDTYKDAQLDIIPCWTRWCFSLPWWFWCVATVAIVNSSSLTHMTMGDMCNVREDHSSRLVWFLMFITYHARGSRGG